MLKGLFIALYSVKNRSLGDLLLFYVEEVRTMRLKSAMENAQRELDSEQHLPAVC